MKLRLCGGWARVYHLVAAFMGQAMRNSIRSRFLRTTRAAAFLTAAAAPHSAASQIVADSLFEWQGYARHSQTRIWIFAATDEKRPHTVVVQEVAENRGLSTTEDARYVVEQIGREHGLDPADVTWFFRWGFYSFEGADTSDKEVVLRATFNRTKSGNLGLPLWRVATMEDVDEATDRHFKRTRATASQ